MLSGVVAALLLQVKLVLAPALLQALPLEEDFAAGLDGWKVVAPEGFSGKVLASGGLVIEAREDEYACVERSFERDGTDARPLVIEASCATDGGGSRGKFAPRVALSWGKDDWIGLGPGERGGSVAVSRSRGAGFEPQSFALRARAKYLGFYRIVLTSERIWFFFSRDGLGWSLACRVPREKGLSGRPSHLVVGRGPGAGKAGSGRKVRCVFGHVRAYAAQDLRPAEIEKKDDWDSTRRALTTETGPFLTDWVILGPFDNRENKGFWGTGPGEKGFDPDAEYDGLKGKVSWRKVKPDETKDGWLIDLDKAVDRAKWSYAYARTEIESPPARAVLLLGTDDCAVAWLNGTRVFHADVWRGVSKDQDKVACTLRPGRNVLLLKVTQGDGAFGFCARLAGAQTAETRARQLLALLELFPEDARATAARLELAKALEEALRFNEARRLLEEAASDETADYALLELVRLNSALGDEARAERAAEKLREKSDSPRTSIALARVLSSARARVELRRVPGMRNAGPDDARRAWLLFSLIERRSGDVDAAVKALKSAAESAPPGHAAFAARAEAARLLLSADREKEAAGIIDQIARTHALAPAASAAPARLVEMAVALACGGGTPWRPARAAGKDWDGSLRAMRDGSPRKCVRDWLVCGVLPNKGGRGFAEEFPPETSRAPRAFSHDGKRYEWKKHSEKRRDEIDLSRVLSHRGPGVVYALWTCPDEPPPGDILFGDGGPSAVWVDGKKVYANPLGDGSFEMDEHRIRARLRKGSAVLIKLAATGRERLCFYFRVGKKPWRELEIEEQSGLALAFPLSSRAPGAWREVALHLAALGKDDDARKAAEALSLAYPELVSERLRAYRGLAGVLRRRKKYVLAASAELRAFGCAHERDDRSLCAQALDGLIEGAEDYFRAGRPREALRALQKAWEWSPGDPRAGQAALRSAAYHRDAGHKEEALAGYRFARSLWGHIERVRKEVEQGVARARKFRGGMVVVEDSFEARRLVERGAWKLRRARPREAGVHLRELARNCLGEVFDAGGGLYVGTARALKAILLSEPADSPIWPAFLGEGRGRARVEPVEEDALLSFAREHPVTPQEERALSRAGDLARDRGRFAGAAELYTRARESPFASKEDKALATAKIASMLDRLREAEPVRRELDSLAPAWKHLYSWRGSWGPPRESGGRVIYRAGRRLVALDGRTGEVLWSHGFEAAPKRRVLSVETRDGRAFSLSGPSKMSAVAIATGRLLWETALDRMEFASSPSIGHDRVYAAALRKGELDSSYLVCLNAETGRIEWQTFLSSGPSGVHCPPPMPDEGAVCCLNNLGAASAVDALTGDRLWVRVYPRREPAGKGSQALAGDAFVVSPADGRGLYAYSRDSGELLWKDEVSPQRSLADGGENELVVWGPNGARGVGPSSGETTWTVQRELVGPPVRGLQVLLPSRDGIRTAEGEPLVEGEWPVVRPSSQGLLVAKPGEIACFSAEGAAPRVTLLRDDEGLAPAGGGVSSREPPEFEKTEFSLPAYQSWELPGAFKKLLPAKDGRLILVDEFGATLVQDGLPPAAIWRFECGFEPLGTRLSGESLLMWGRTQWSLNDAGTGKRLAAGRLPGEASSRDAQIRCGDAGPKHTALAQRYSLSVLDLKGKRLWRRSVRDPSALLFARGSLWLLESRYHDTRLTAFEPEDGSVLWTEKLTDKYGWFPVSVLGDAAYIVPSGGGQSFKVDLESRKVKTFELEGLYDQQRFTRRGRLFLLGGRQRARNWHLQCFDAELRTVYSGHARLWDSDGRKLVVAEPEKLKLVDAPSRREAWSLSRETKNVRLLKIVGGRVFVLDDGGGLRALSVADGKEEWSGHAPRDASECALFGGSLAFRSPRALVGLRKGEPEPAFVNPSARVRGVVRAEACARSRPRLLAFRRGAEAESEEAVFGSEGEWVSSPLGLSREERWGGPEDVRGRFSASWDGRSLLVRLRVRDDRLDPLGDGAELFLGWRDRSLVKRFSFDEPWRFLPDGLGWEHEFRVDWRELIGDERPRPWLGVRMSLRVHDFDGDGREGYLEWGSPREQASYGELVLVGLSADVEARYWQAMGLVPGAPEARRLFVDIVKNLPGREKRGRAERFLRVVGGTPNERFARAWLEFAGGPEAEDPAELRQEVFLDASAVPRELMIEFFDGSSWEHRAFWGRDELGYGERGTPSRLRVGGLPKAGEWAELSVRPGTLELNRVQGISFRARGGKAFWGRTILAAAQGETVLVEDRSPEGSKVQGKFRLETVSGRKAHAADDGHSFTWEGVTLEQPAREGLSSRLFTSLREASRVLADDDAGRPILNRLVSFIRGRESSGKVRVEYEAFVRACPRKRNVVAALEALSRIYSQTGVTGPLDECANLIGSAGVSVTLAREFWRKLSPPYRDFFLLGPYGNEGNKASKTAYPPEKGDLDLAEAERPYKSSPEGYCDLDRVFKKDWYCAYAFTRAHSPRRRTVRLYFGADEGVQVWVNGRSVAGPMASGAQLDRHSARAVLRPGWNDILVKVWDQRYGSGLYFRIADLNGRPYADVRLDAEGGK